MGHLSNGHVSLDHDALPNAMTLFCLWVDNLREFDHGLSKLSAFGSCGPYELYARMNRATLPSLFGEFGLGGCTYRDQTLFWFASCISITVSYPHAR